MASFLMHLCIGKFFKDRYKKITDLPQFYLGCIYPDSVNAFGFAPKEVRWPAHFRSDNTNEWYENNRVFYHLNKGKIEENLLLGYVVHNITDAAFDEHYNKDIDRDDWYRFSQQQCKAEWWLNEVVPALKMAVPIEINGISKVNVEKWLTSITDGSKFNCPDDKPIQLTINMMNDLSDIVYNVISDLIYNTQWRREYFEDAYKDGDESQLENFLNTAANNDPHGVSFGLDK